MPASTAVLAASADEPPIPDDADDPSATVGEDASAAAQLPPGRSALSHEQRAALESRVRAEAKAHPRVREVIEALDAELREIRVDTRDFSRSGGSA
jgi:hypothetical protein